jgi:8-oxo-dGTP pyrophosphatase MutT (NUDIX family)
VEYPIEGKSDAPSFIRRMYRALRKTLPGTSAQAMMAPQGREQQPHPTYYARQSAVLALLHTLPGYRSVPDAEALALLFTLRPNSLRHHAGQISFPGGGMEPQDDSLVATALRETAEELGIPTNDIHILGEITPLYIAPSQNLVHPFVGWLPHLPPLDPDPAEVSEVLDVPLNHLLDPRNTGNFIWSRNGQSLDAPCYLLPPAQERQGQAPNARVHIWGATAMILSELLEIVRSLVTSE